MGGKAAIWFRLGAVGLGALLIACARPQFAHAATADICPPPSTLPLATTQPIPSPERSPELMANVARQLGENASFGAITLGDSIMRGWPPEQLSRAMGTRVLNAAIPGDSTGRVLWRLNTLDWSKQSPLAVLVMVGTNDLQRAACEVFWGIRTVVTRAHRVFPQSRIVVSTLLPRGERMGEFDAKIALVNSALLAATDTHEYALFDPHDLLLCGHVTPCALFQANNLQISPQGYDVLSKALADTMHNLPAQ